MAGRQSLYGKFVSRKINKIRWRPEKNSKLGIPADFFLCGSHDDEDNQINLWKLPDESQTFKEVSLVASVPHPEGDINEIQFIDEDNFLTASSSGNIGLYKITGRDEVQITKQHTWDAVHKLNEVNVRSSCNGIDTFEDDMISVGSDGKLNILNLYAKKDPIRVIEADSSPILCVCFLKHNEGMTGGMRGQIKVWDLRQAENKPVHIMFLTKIDSHSGPRGYPDTHHPAATCAACHPTQSHILITGSEDGEVSVWDLRNATYPVCVLESHNSSVNEVCFHPLKPDHMFSCSESGQLWHWDCTYPPILNPYETNLLPRDQCTWLALGMSKHRPRVMSLMPPLDSSVNSLDISGDVLVCGTDRETVYVCSNIQFIQF